MELRVSLSSSRRPGVATSCSSAEVKGHCIIRAGNFLHQPEVTDVCSTFQEHVCLTERVQSICVPRLSAAGFCEFLTYISVSSGRSRPCDPLRLVKSLQTSDGQMRRRTPTFLQTSVLNLAYFGQMCFPCRVQTHDSTRSTPAYLTTAPQDPAGSHGTNGLRRHRIWFSESVARVRHQRPDLHNGTGRISTSGRRAAGEKHVTKAKLLYSFSLGFFLR